MEVSPEVQQRTTQWLFLDLGHITDPIPAVLFTKESYFFSDCKNAFLANCFFMTSLLREADYFPKSLSNIQIFSS